MEDVITSFKDLFRKIDIKDGMTISFHHHLREGDKVLLKVMDEISKTGVKNLILSASSLRKTHEKLVKYIKQGIISEIRTTGLKGELAEFVIKGNMKNPVIFRSHGARARAISEGEDNIDIAFIAASKADFLGNATGSLGKNAFGSIGYGIWDAKNSKKTVIVTDDISFSPLDYISIPQYLVDYIVKVDCIGNNEGILSDSLVPKVNYTNKLIAQNIVKVIQTLFNDSPDFSLQMGSGGISLQVIRYLKDFLKEKNSSLKFVVGGITKDLIDFAREGYIRKMFDVQSFHPEAAESIVNSHIHQEIDLSWYANPKNKLSIIKFLDIAILSALEIDIDWNVNVLTSSFGEIIGSIGGHQDVAQEAKITIIAAPLIRKRIPIVVEKVHTKVTEGKYVDILVTDFGIAVREDRTDIIKKLKDNGIKITKIIDLHKTAISITGKPDKVEKRKRIVGIVQDRLGGILDYIYSK